MPSAAATTSEKLVQREKETIALARASRMRRRAKSARKTLLVSIAVPQARPYAETSETTDSNHPEAEEGTQISNRFTYTTLVPPPLLIRKQSSQRSRTRDARSTSSGTETCIYDTDSSTDRLVYWRRYFDNGPLRKCLETNDEEYLGKILYERLLEETKEVTSDDLGNGHKGELSSRLFWKNFRKQLRDSDVDEYED